MMDFTFVVITYNHEAYVLEHLESIAYQIREHGQGYSFQLIVADDASKDQTLALVRHWLNQHASLFADVQIHTQATNQGTCDNYTKVWQYVRGDVCKLTAGDDVYSGENLLAEWRRLHEHDISSGYPLNLIDGQLSWPAFFNVNMVASNWIYGRGDYIKRMLGINFSHTPSIVFSTRVLRDDVIRDFVRQFAVTEDFPLHVKMAERFTPLSFSQSPLVHIYYRRTAGSTYLVRSAAFDKDKIAIFRYLRDHVARGFERLLISNRMFCFRQTSPWKRRLLNLNYLVYGTRAALHGLSILSEYRQLKPELEKHRLHYQSIRTRAEAQRAAFIP
ncbi:glycosyltransferase family 2 protein [Devosia sp.]|uniref:glycosyltransferase family 2 protein n=1 Tax=Devosia sp. TaxID=1871048 RepID=UPI002732A80A|nr:glycosyltransferase family 2 protein [Devosia sp.]MDP2782155.1 glycosyltransferase family 2 protein [Devosia sp.]